MKWIRLLPVIFVAFCLPASAISLPLSPLPHTTFNDSTLTASKTGVPAPVPVVKKTGLFYRLKEKITGLFAHSDAGTSEQKRKLALVSGLLLVVGIGLVVVTGSLLALLISGAGLVTGIIALTMKGEPGMTSEPQKAQTASAPKHKSWFGRNLVWIIPVTVIVGGLAALLIALGNAHF